MLGGCSGAGDGAEWEESARSATALVEDVTTDATGNSITVSATAIDQGPDNPFFHDFGSNRRTCGTCHVEAVGWTVTPAYARTLPASDPLFVFDGSDCLPPGVPNPDPATHSRQMLGFGNVRVELPIPPGADFVLTGYLDPLGCPSPPGAAALRVYRRPPPASNTAFLTTVMWDGRENVAATVRDDLAHQSNDATLGHAQATASLPDASRAAIVGFETALFNAQHKVGRLNLHSHRADGGGAYLYTDVLPAFFIGINDPFQPGFTSEVFTLYRAWEPGAWPGAPTAQAAAIGRGERVFDTRPIDITDVAGLNGPNDASQGPIAGFCGTCHDTPNVGNHSVPLAIDIGVTAAAPVGGLDVRYLPRYRFRQIRGGRTIEVTDPGRALVTGKFTDIGKTKGPILRGLAARAPYFHNGSARDLAAVVEFYDRRFAMGLTAQEKSDLVAFLGAL
jgi:cytochrome c peroxidase